MLQIVIVVLVEDCLLSGINRGDIVGSIELVSLATIVGGLRQRILENLVACWQCPLCLTDGIVFRS